MSGGRAIASSDPRKVCGAPKHRGGFCSSPPGSGTPHPGRGPCKFHGGCLPAIIAKYAREEAADRLGMALAIEVEPTEALLSVVHAFAGQAYVAARRVEAVEADPDVSIAERRYAHEVQREVLRELARSAKMAIDGGVAERRVRLAERMGELIAAAGARAIAAMGLPGEDAARFARLFAAELQVLEQTGGEDIVEA